MIGKNDHILEYLRFYVSLDAAPGFAVMIKGPWGCGKTQLVHSFTENLASESAKFLYVSLYGISSTNEIGWSIFRQLHPLLASKGSALLGQIASTGMKYFNIESKIKLDQLILDPEKHVLVFDDVERCNMDYRMLFGYINNYIEKEGGKVILIADEDKIVTESKADLALPDRCTPLTESYLHTKEKLIGKTFRILPSFDSAFNAFVHDVRSSPDFAKALVANRETLKEVFDKAQYGNLRSLRMAILEARRLWDVLQVEIREKDELITQLLLIFTLLSLEVRSGSVVPSEFVQLCGRSAAMHQYLRSQDKNPSPDKFAEIQRKYPYYLADSLLDPSQWEQIFATGMMDGEFINQALRDTPHFLEETMPVWQKLWYLHSLEDEKFSILLEAFSREWDDYAYRHPAVILHVSAMHIEHARQKLIAKDTEQAVSDACSYIDAVFKQELVEIDKDSEYAVSRGSAAYGLGYTRSDTIEFKNVQRHLLEALKKATDDLLNTEALRIEHLMSDKPVDLYPLLCWCDGASDAYQSRPILHKIPEESFVDNLMRLTTANKRTMGNILLARYDSVLACKNLLPEYPWLKDVLHLLSEQVSTRAPSPSRIALNDIVMELQKSLDYFVLAMKHQEAQKEVPVE